jgi:hypothetical protein
MRIQVLFYDENLLLSENTNDDLAFATGATDTQISNCSLCLMPINALS